MLQLFLCSDALHDGIYVSMYSHRRPHSTFPTFALFLCLFIRLPVSPSLHSLQENLSVSLHVCLLIYLLVRPFIRPSYVFVPIHPPIVQIAKSVIMKLLLKHIFGDQFENHHYHYSQRLRKKISQNFTNFLDSSLISYLVNLGLKPFLVK